MKSNRAEALVSQGGSEPSGKNQIGLNGINYYSNIHPFTNWWKNGSRQQLDLTFKSGISSLTWAAGVAMATTAVPHGLFQSDSGANNVGWAFTITAENPAYNHGGVADATITGPTTFTYPLANDPGGRSSGSFAYSVFQDKPPNTAHSGWGQNSNLTQYFDADGNVQANIPGVTSLTLTRVYHGLDASHGAIVPPGYSRAGQKFIVRYRPLGGSPVEGNFVWEKSRDSQNQQIQLTAVNPSAPPRDVYVGLTDNLAAWDAGLCWEPAYENMLRESAGVIRFMDMMQTNGNFGVTSLSKVPTTANAYWGNVPNTIPPLPAVMPIAVMTQLANRVNKHPWFNIPTQLGMNNQTIIGITKANPAVVTTLFKHTYKLGDRVIPWLVNGTGVNNVGFGQQESVTFNVATSTVNWAGHTFAAGQNVYFGTGGPRNVPQGQSFYVTNVATGTFQLASSLKNALSGTAMTFTGPSTGTVAAISTVNRNQFVVGAVTDTTLELLYCDSSSFGTAPTRGNITTPFDLSAMTKEVTSFVLAIKNQLNKQLIPRFEWGNELWNTIFPSFAWLAAQAHCFTDSTTGLQIFPTDGSTGMAGYLIGHVMKTVRDVYGGAEGRAHWHGILAAHTSEYPVATGTAGLLAGMTKYITNVLGGTIANVPDYINDIALTNYYGGAFVSNGVGGNFSNVTISVGAPSTVALSSGKNLLAANRPIIFTSTGTLPIDAATGQPIIRGDMSPQCSFIATATAGILSVTKVVSGKIDAGMTVLGNMTNGNGIFQSGVTQRVIQPFGSRGTTGTGGVGTYATDVLQAIPTPTVMLAQNTTLNTGVYWTLDTGNTFRFSATRGGPPVNISGLGTGTHNCLFGTSTWLVTQMNQSMELHSKDPAKYPSKYTYWNEVINRETYDAPITGWGGGLKALNGAFAPHVTVLANNGLIPAVGVVMYEGGQSNEMKNNNAPNGVLMVANPMFQEFWPQHINTVEDGANWTALVTIFANLPMFTGQSKLRVGFPSKFTDATNLTFTFGFGGLSYVDHYAGIGSPNWQNTTSPGGLWSAVLATNY